MIFNWFYLFKIATKHYTQGMIPLLYRILIITLASVYLAGCNGDKNYSTDDDTSKDTGTGTDTDTVLPPLSLDVNKNAAPLVADGHYFRDAKGGVVMLRGVNVAGNSKVPPFTPVSDITDLEILPRLGFNTIRLLFIWEAFEPVQGEYNNEYLTYFMKVVDWADELGLYVVTDFHQDAYSRYSLDGCGEGFPGWAVTPQVKLSTPDNGEACTLWGINMVSDESLITIWSDFHSDAYGAKSAYLKMVETVAKSLLPYDNVIGYDLINEPWGDDDDLFTLFDQIGRRIRKADPDAILFVPAHALVTGGVRINNVPMIDLDNVAYSPHYYNGVVLLQGKWLKTDPAPDLNKLRAKAAIENVPMFLGEFGAPAATENGQGYMEAQFDWLDRYFISGAQWNYTPGWQKDVKDGWNMEDLSIIDDTGALRANFVRRPYPQRISGAPISFQTDDKGFTLYWENRKGYGETIIHLPEGYEKNREITVTPGGKARGECTISDNSLICNIEGDGEVRVSFQ
ncbi:MAG: cellulase family glycosylhydrolase [Deltaproteobacteria bacterium]|nr:cellulase family glycosylhydrolase [Deltaproteobacteria bacterium]